MPAIESWAGDNSKSYHYGAEGTGGAAQQKDITGLDIEVLTYVLKGPTGHTIWADLRKGASTENAARKGGTPSLHTDL